MLVDNGERSNDVEVGRAKGGKARESLDAERVDGVVAAAVKDMALVGCQREDILGTFFLVQWLLGLSEVVDEQCPGRGAALARRKHQICTRHQLKCLYLFLEANKLADSCKTDNVPHHDDPFSGGQ